MPGIGVIYNPRSGRNLRDPKAARRLSVALGDHGVVREAGSIDELYRVAEDFRSLDIDVLGISGGDGTNGVTITGFLDVYQSAALPQIAFLRGGTMNTAANSVGVRRGGPKDLLDRLVQAYVERASIPLQDVERHVLKLRGESSGPRSPRSAADAAPASMLVAAARGEARLRLRHRRRLRLSRRVLRGRKGKAQPRRGRQDAPPRHRQRDRGRRDDPSHGRAVPRNAWSSTTAPSGRSATTSPSPAGPSTRSASISGPFHRYAEQPGALPHPRHPHVADGLRRGSSRGSGGRRRCSPDTRSRRRPRAS